MGKITPPAEVFNEWSPEAQESYNARLDNMAAERDTHLDKANQLEESAKIHDQNAENARNAMRDDRGKFGSDDWKEGSVGARAGNMVVDSKETSMANADRQAAAAEKAQADAIQSDIDAQTIQQPDQCVDDPAEVKQQYMDETHAQLDADKAKRDELKEKRSKLQQERDDTWFFTGAIDEQIAATDAELAAVESDIAYNEQNMENSTPETPAAPDMGMPCIQHYITSGAKLMCPFAAGTGTLTVNRPSPLHDNKPIANIADCQPMANISSFGMCTTLSNPQVASATSAALGVLTPQPCIPAIVGMWKPGKPDTLIAETPALLNTDTLQCMWGGVITIQPG